MANIFNVNKPHTQKRRGSKRQSKATAKISKSRARLSTLGPPTAAHSKSGVLYVHATSNKKANKKSRNVVYKKQRLVKEVMEREGEVDMGGAEPTVTETSIIATRKAERKAAIAAEGQDLAEEKATKEEGVANEMEIDEGDAL